MSEQLTHVDLRFDNKIWRLRVDHTVATALVTERSEDGIEAICFPSGRADISKYDRRSGVLLYQGLGSWQEPSGEKPAVGVRIRIPSTAKVKNESTGRVRVYHQGLTVYAIEDLDEFVYRFIQNGEELSVGMEDVQGL